MEIRMVIFITIMYCIDSEGAQNKNIPNEMIKLLYREVNDWIFP